MLLLKIMKKLMNIHYHVPLSLEWNFSLYFLFDIEADEVVLIPDKNHLQLKWKYDL